MKSLDEYMAYYADLFSEPSSKRLLKICVPITFFCVFALLWSMSFWLFLLAGLATVGFYYSLDKKTALAGALAIGIAWALQLILGLGGFALIVLLLLSVVGQLYAQNLEGEKLSALENFLFQLVGPLWALGPRNLRKFDLY